MSTKAPTLGSVIYLLDRVDGQIVQETVEFIGKSSFLIRAWDLSTKPEYDFSEKGHTWFETREEAEDECKKIMLRKYKEHVIRFEPNSTNSWWNPVTEESQ